MNKGVKLTSLLLMAIILGPLTTPVMAASQDECAIWLCLPGGFPSGCGAAHAAMAKRISHLKPPLPPFSSCSANGSGSMNYEQSTAAYVPEQRVCSKKWPRGGCREYREVKAHWVDGASCRFSGRYDGPGEIRGGNVHYSEGTAPRCSSTSNTIQIFDHGKQMGNTFYWNH